MKLLFAIQTPFYPDSCGGAELSTLTLFRQLRQRGWKIEVLCGLLAHSPYLREVSPTGWDPRFLLGRRPAFITEDRASGFRCRRVLGGLQVMREEFRRRLQLFQPDLVLGHLRPSIPLLRNAAHKGYPAFYFVRSVDDLEPGFHFPPGVHVIANSPFCASVTGPMTSQKVGVVLPLVRRASYRIHRRRRRYITFINPIPEKGVKIAVETARRLPQEQFLFVKGAWFGYVGKDEKFLRPVSKLRNVKVLEYKLDMRPVYSVTDILLVPSQFNEPLPRVVLEAHLNGIPVVASAAGGIPYAMGKGGLLVRPKDDPEQYAQALNRLRSDPALYRELSTEAVLNSRRPEFDPAYQVERFIHFVQERTR